MNIGFTGTRNGMSVNQSIALCSLLTNLAIDEAHHGCCIGADEQFDKFIRRKVCTIHLHPPTDKRRMMDIAGREKFCVVHPAKDFHSRNRDIVDTCDAMYACPEEDADQPRGGTWYTVRYAKSKKKPVVIIWPDGSIEKREPR